MTTKSAVKTVDERALPQNLPTAEMVRNAKHAASFPPGTPHSVINHFAPALDEASDQVADPRDAPMTADPLSGNVVAPAGSVPDKAPRKTVKRGASKKITPSADTSKKADLAIGEPAKS